MTKTRLMANGALEMTLKSGGRREGDRLLVAEHEAGGQETTISTSFSAVQKL